MGSSCSNSSDDVVKKNPKDKNNSNNSNNNQENTRKSSNQQGNMKKDDNLRANNGKLKEVSYFINSKISSDPNIAIFSNPNRFDDMPTYGTYI